MNPQNTDTTWRRDDPLWGLLPHLSAHRLALAWTGVVGLANNLALVFLAVSGSYAVTLALFEGQLASTRWWIAATVAVLLRAVLTWHEMDLSHSIAYRVLAALRMALFDGFSRGVPSRKAGQHTGRLAATAMGDTEKLEFFYAHTLTQLASAVVLLLGGTAVLLRIDGALAAGLVLGLAALVLLTLPWQRANARLGEEVQRAKSDQSALAVDLLAGSREILGFGLQAQVQRQLAAATRTVARAERRLKSREAAAASVRELCSLCILVAVFLAAWNQPGLDRLWIPALVAGTLTLLSPLMEAVAVLTQLQPHRASAARVLEGIAMPAEGPNAVPTLAFAPSGPLGIEVRGACFSYEDGTPALEPTWLSVSPGEHLGISGRSGSGKTTLARLLVRLWSPDAGSIGLVPRTGAPVDTASIDPRAFRSLVTLVEQDATIFHGTLLENMKLAVPGATEGSALDALGRAGLRLEAGRWPEGVHTVIGEAGAGVSGGERARMALARALLLDPSVLVLDETTASLDAATEALLLDAVEQLAGDMTVVTISHRESTLARCDRRVELADLHRAPQAQPT
jgi:ATP-binding cassette subfamily C protein CydC